MSGWRGIVIRQFSDECSEKVDDDLGVESERLRRLSLRKRIFLQAKDA